MANIKVNAFDANMMYETASQSEVIRNKIINIFKKITESADKGLFKLITCISEEDTYYICKFLKEKDFIVEEIDKPEGEFKQQRIGISWEM